jgi:single-stranded-DNA-specific exonuclease
MGKKFARWEARSTETPRDFDGLAQLIYRNRSFAPLSQLQYGDHGLEAVIDLVSSAIRAGRRIALYADYDVDGTMSCVSWIWFLRSIGHTNFTHYIPDRFKEGYGVNLQAIQHLVENEKAQLIITMDTGITANIEAEWCRSRGVDFICTDHHKIQIDKMPDCTILNPKLHPDPTYQELCGCGITFVLLRKLGEIFNPPAQIWVDLLALTGMATICDVVPLNSVNHKLVQQGVQAIWKSQRPILRHLMAAAALDSQSFDERDVGFKLGPRINAVGRLDHAHKVIEAFVNDDATDLIRHMSRCNEQRKSLQREIVAEARAQAMQYPDAPVLFLGGDWHIGVVGIAASKIAETFWKPTWLFNRSDSLCKGSARSIPGFDVTDAMSHAKDLFTKFGGHKAAGGFSFDPAQEDRIRAAITEYAQKARTSQPTMWESKVTYDCNLLPLLVDVELLEYLLPLRPFGHGFEEPVFKLEATVQNVRHYKDKVTGAPKHTAIEIGDRQKIMFFNEVHEDLMAGQKANFLVTASQNVWQGQVSLSLMGVDYAPVIH